MKQPKKTKLTAQEIANLAGVSLTLVNRKLSQGRTAREIIYEAEVQAQQMALKHPVVNVTDVTGLNGLNGHAAGLSFSGAQTAKENALAELRQLELSERRRELLPVKYLRIWGMRFLVEGRDVLLNGSGELVDRLAAESSPRAVTEILNRWVDRTMEHFFRLETLWAAPGETFDEVALRERFEATRLAVVKPRR